MKRIFLHIILLTVVLPLGAQTGYWLKGKVTDTYTGKPVSSVHIKLNNTTSGTITNRHGLFRIHVQALPVKLKFSHLSYGDTLLTINSISFINLELNTNPQNLPQVEVSGEKVVNLINKKLLGIVDYEFFGDSILMLAYDYLKSKEQNPLLILMSPKGDTLNTSFIGKDGFLYKDCMGYLHLVGQDTSYQIHKAENRFKLIYPVETKVFVETMSSCVASLENKYFVQEYSMHNQVASFFLYDFKNKKMEEFHTVKDDDAIAMLIDRNRFHAMGKEPTQADLRFEEMCFFDPIFVPLLQLDTQICIMNYVNNKLELFNSKGEKNKEVSINFHQNRFWKEEVYSDEVAGKIYAKFLKSGKTVLKEINIETGEITNEIKVPDYRYIEKISVHNDYLYFLYSETLSGNLVKLYQMDLR